MKLDRKAITIVLAAVATGFSATAGDISHPERISSENISGKIFERPDVIETTGEGNTTLDVTAFLNSAGTFGSGM